MVATTTKDITKEIRLLISDTPHSVPILVKKLKTSYDDVRDALANIADAKEFPEGWAIAVSPHQRYRDKYGFTPSEKQIVVLDNPDCTAVFDLLDSYKGKGVSTLASFTRFSELQVTQTLEVLKRVNLAFGSENCFFSGLEEMQEIEEIRLRLLEALDEPQSLDNWAEPFITDWNQEIASSAIALLQEEGVVQFDAKTETYYRVEKKNGSVDTNNGASEHYHNTNPDTTNDVDNKTPQIKDIKLDGGTQPRIRINEDVVAEYAEDMVAGSQFPPIIVYFDGVTYWLADGFHRYHAAMKAEVEIPIEVHTGTRRDAILHSVGANANHGLRRSNEDKRKAVLTLLEDKEWSEWSNRAIATQCHVSHTFVASIRKESGGNEKPRKVRRNDQEYELTPPKKEALSGNVARYKKEDGNDEEVQPQSTAVGDTWSYPLEEVVDTVMSEDVPPMWRWRKDIHHKICNFLGVESNSSDISDKVLYLIPNDYLHDTEYFTSFIIGNHLTEAIVATEDIYGSQAELRGFCNAIAIVSDSQQFCSRILFYYGDRVREFKSHFADLFVVEV